MRKPCRILQSTTASRGGLVFQCKMLELDDLSRILQTVTNIEKQLFFNYFFLIISFWLFFCNFFGGFPDQLVQKFWLFNADSKLGCKYLSLANWYYKKCWPLGPCVKYWITNQPTLRVGLHSIRITRGSIRASLVATFRPSASTPPLVMPGLTHSWYGLSDQPTLRVGWLS